DRVSSLAQQLANIREDIGRGVNTDDVDGCTNRQIVSALRLIEGGDRIGFGGVSSQDSRQSSERQRFLYVDSCATQLEIAGHSSDARKQTHQYAKPSAVDERDVVKIENEKVMNRKQIANVLMKSRCLSAFDDAAAAFEHCDVADRVRLQRKTHGSSLCGH